MEVADALGRRLLCLLIRVTYRLDLILSPNDPASPTMCGLRWTYSDLLDWYARGGRTETGPVNPLIEQLLLACPSSTIFAIGGHSVVIRISPGIVAKVAVKAGDDRLQNEQKVFNFLQESTCRHVVRCFFHAVDVSFLECVPRGTLYDRMGVVDRPKPVRQWMLQLTSAAACLEDLGYAHGDINPQNVLVADDDQLKLIDFDHSLQVGDPLDVGYEPYVRHNRGFTDGQYGTAGPQTEQFALGSMFWFWTRETEVYSELPGNILVDNLIDGIFPTIDEADPIDKIIDNCWHGRYSKVADLLEDVGRLDGVTPLQPQHVDPDEMAETRRVCEEHYNRAVGTS